MFPIYHKICPEGVFEKIIRIKSSETDTHIKIQPGDLAREMGKITAEHFESLGLGLEELTARNRLWVVAWSSIWIKDLPRYNDVLILRVWPGARKNVMCPRKYVFYAPDGEPLIGASALFVMMHSKTRVIAMPIDKVAAIPGVIVEGEPELPKFQIVFPDLMQKKVSRIVQEDEIDHNGHLNNAYYLDWAMQLAENLCLGVRTPHFIWVKYKKELIVGQEVALHYEYQEDVLYIHGISQGISSFMLAVDYRSQCKNI